MGNRDELIINGKEIIAGYNPLTGEEFLADYRQLVQPDSGAGGDQ